MRILMAAADPIVREDALEERWLSIVGVGEDGVDGLSRMARELIEGAEFVFGGKRHLSLVAPLVRGAARVWPSPFDRAVGEVLSRRGRRVCVLASGDPFHYGAGAALLRHIEPRETFVIPAPSSFGLAAARLGWSIPEATLVSLHGRPLDLLRPYLQPRARVLTLTSDAQVPQAIAGLLAQNGFGTSRLTVLEALGGPRERIRSATANAFSISDIDPLNIVAIEVEAETSARILPRTAGLSDSLFEHDGQITKREVRAVTLSSLAPRRGESLWDVGAGTGSVGIEWMLADPSLRAIAIEARTDRVARIAHNAQLCGVPGLEIRDGRAPAALEGLPPPDAIFIGGGATEDLLDFCARALRSGGRIVVNAVTLETERLLISRHQALGGELIRIALARAEPIGSASGWRAAMPVTQWAWWKP
jgi:precorrin-6Y C5,15-methyltransferase (decarboxylating)